MGGQHLSNRRLQALEQILCLSRGRQAGSQGAIFVLNSLIGLSLCVVGDFSELPLEPSRWRGGRYAWAEPGGISKPVHL
jgi:hypothetical protein